MKEAQQRTGKASATPKNNEKPGFFKRLGRGFKETFAELKKVSWPSFSDTVKQLGAVIAVVLFFLVILMGFDALLGWLFRSFTEQLSGANLLNAIGWFIK